MIGQSRKDSRDHTSRRHEKEGGQLPSLVKTCLPPRIVSFSSAVHSQVDLDDLMLHLL